MKGRDGSSEEFDGLQIGLLTWIGLVVAALGWALVLGEAALADLVVIKGVHPPPPALHADLLTTGRCLIDSGFGLAIIGALQSGFGTLNRFFGAVLNRSNQRAAAVTPAPISEREDFGRDNFGRDGYGREPPREQRPYRMLPDGSVEVETILGTRRFNTMAEAREFI